MSSIAVSRTSPPETANPANVVTFVCCDCAREENSPRRTIPPGWDKVAPDAVRCPDCNTLIEAMHSQRARERRPTTPFPHPNSGFHVNLERQNDGEYLIAIAPAHILMRWLPLGFFATPDEARALAADLRRYAALAENRGELPAPLDAAS